MFERGYELQVGGGGLISMPRVGKKSGAREREKRKEGEKERKKIQSAPRHKKPERVWDTIENAQNP